MGKIFKPWKSGFTLIEVLLAAALISAIGIAIASATSANASARRVLDEKIQATNLVTAYLEEIRQMDYSDNSSPYSSVSENIIPPPQYVISMHFAYSNDGNTWETTNHSGTWHLQRISVTVSREGGRDILTTCTFKSPRIE